MHTHSWQLLGLILVIHKLSILSENIIVLLKDSLKMELIMAVKNSANFKRVLYYMIPL